PQRAHQHLVEADVGLALLRHLIDGLEHGHGGRHAIEVLTHRPEMLDGLGLTHDAEITPALVQEQADVAARLEPAPRPALGLAHALGHGPDLPVALGDEGDDAVGLAQPMRAQHHPLVAVEAHDRQSAPNRRLRVWKSFTAWYR